MALDPRYINPDDIPPGAPEDFSPTMTPVGDAMGDFLFISDVDGDIVLDGDSVINGDLEIQGDIGFYGGDPIRQQRDIPVPDLTLQSLQESLTQVIELLRKLNIIRVEA